MNQPDIPLSSRTSIIDRKMADEPIEVPGNPFWEVMQGFGFDEGLALICSTAGIAALSHLTTNPASLALGGAILEKAGLLGRHIKNGLDVFHTTPKAQRKSLGYYVMSTLKAGSSSLIKDVGIHDPIYGVLTYAGLRANPQTPPWIINFPSFIGGVVVAAAAETAFHETRYHQQLRRLQRVGFSPERYLESRFYIKGAGPDDILKDLSETFALTRFKQGEYHDRYFGAKVPSFNNRERALRLRQRYQLEGNGYKQSAQVVYTRPTAEAKKDPDQFNYYPTRKDKLWIPLDGEMPWKIEDISDKDLRQLCTGFVTGEPNDVHFVRHVAFDPDKPKERIMASVDVVENGDSEGLTLVELKAYNNKPARKLLIEAMRHVMLQEYTAIQTTHGKYALVSLGR